MSLLKLLRGVCLGLFISTTIFSSSKEKGVESEIWCLEQEFVKFGKKDVYEFLKKGWTQQFKKFSAKKGTPRILAFQEDDTLQYYYFMPMKNYAGIDTFLKLLEDFQNAGGNWKNQTLMLQSSLNYSINSVQRYLPLCSYENGMQESFGEMDYGHYFVFSLVPGNDSFFEEKLQKIVADAAEQQSLNQWKVWKVLFGGDVPKYVICVFAKSSKDLEERVKTFEFSDMATKEIITRDRQGKVHLRRDLSILP